MNRNEPSLSAVLLGLALFRAWRKLRRRDLTISVATSWLALCTFVLPLCPLPASSAEATTAAGLEDAERRARLAGALPAIEQAMEERRRLGGWPGLAYGIVIDGEPVAVRGLGLRDLASSAPMTADTAFPIGSMTKSFLALAVLKLRDEGKLSLDDPASRFVLELRHWKGLTRDAGPITIRHLLTHTAGLPDDNAWGGREAASMTDAEYSAWLASRIPFASATGASPEYSNMGFAILGRVVTRASGKPYAKYIREQILAPLGMKNTSWKLSELPVDRIATGYRRGEAGWVVEPALEFGNDIAAVGGLVSTPNDVARWVGLFLSA